MGLDVLQQVLSGNASAAQAGYLSQVARNNEQMRQREASILEGQAGRAEQRGEAASDKLRLKTAQQIGSARASLAAQGGDVNDGSAPDLIGDIARSGTFDALSARDEAADRAHRLRLQAMNAENAAGLAGAEAGNNDRGGQEAMTQMGLGVAKTLLGSANTMGKWL